MSMRVLMSPMAWGRGWGPIINLHGLAQSLADRGATIGFAGSNRAVRFLNESSDWPMFTLPSPVPGNAEASTFDYLAIQGLGIDYLRATLQAELAAIDSFRPDVIISDFQLTSVIAAGKRAIPHAAIARWTEHSSFTSPIFEHFLGCPSLPPSATADAFNEILCEVNQEQIARHPIELAFERSDVRLTPSSPVVECELAQLGFDHFIGYLDPPELTAGPRSQGFNGPEPESTKILCYLSRKSIKMTDFLPILERVAEILEACIIAIDPDSTSPRKMNERLEVRPFSRSLPILESDVVIGTGTRGLSQQALLAGAGLVLVGSDADEELDFTARRLEGLGTAIRSGKSLRQVISAIQDANTPEARHQARTLGASLFECGGPDRAADMLGEEYG